MKSSLYHLLFFITILMLGEIVGTGCANIIPPTGGPKDSLPPVLVSAVPKDSALNFNAKKIVVTFDEYVELDDKFNEEFIASPNPTNAPLITNKLKTITIALKDSLKPNTTYAFDFGNAVKDIHEGNVFKNFTYVFSTGNTIDNGTLSGNVKIAETGEADSTLIVLLHTNLADSAVKKTKADYYTRLDSSGNFHFRYLPIDTFSIFVLPNDYTKRYDDSTKMFAFYNSTVNTEGNEEQIQLYAYQQEKPKQKSVSASSETSSSSKKEQKEEDKRLKVSTNLENQEQNLLGNLELNFNRKITKFDSTRITLTDTNFLAIPGYSIQRDTLPTKFFLLYKWPEDTEYRLVIQKDAFADSAGITLSKNDTISFSTKKESEYGSVRLHFNNLDLNKNPVLQLIQNNQVYQSIVLRSNEWTVKLFEPGDYELRILFDDNKNGVWDPGNYDSKRQPEIVMHIRRKLNIKANWDNEVDINL